MRMRITVLSALLIAAIAVGASAQQRHWVYFSDRGSAAQLQPAADLLPASTYVHQIEALGAAVAVQSRWLNAVSVAADRAVLERISGLPFVTRIEPVRRYRRDE